MFLVGIQLGNVKGVTLKGNHWRCGCGGWAEVVEGTFDVDGTGPTPIFRQTGGKPVDTELFTRLGLILVQAKLDNLKPNEIVEKVAPHSPALAARLRRVMDDPQAFATLLAALIAGFAIVAAEIVRAVGQPTEPPKVEIIIDRSPGELERDRENLNRLREEGYSVPPWANDFV